MTFTDFFKTVLIGIPIGITFVDVFGYVARVDGVSMRPCFNPDSSPENDYVFLNRLAIRFQKVSRGDVVSLLSPKDPDQKLIKRVIGVEGDVINTVSYKRPQIKVPKGHCWVEGDNLTNSMDSNLFGPIALALITAKATAIVWPPKRWRILRSEVPSERLPKNLTLQHHHST